MERAYSLFNLKSVDDEQRIIEGLASTPIPDRQGDIMEPAGAKFTLPLPLLWQHRLDQPLGHVLAAIVTDKGIEIKAQIAKGIPFIDDAWALMKKGLVSGLSIGWRPLEASRIEGSFGLHVKSWDWFELSAVTVPANTKTTIHRIKALDTEQREAPAPVPLPARVVVRLAPRIRR